MKKKEQEILESKKTQLLVNEKEIKEKAKEKIRKMFEDVEHTKTGEESRKKMVSDIFSPCFAARKKRKNHAITRRAKIEEGTENERKYYEIGS